MDILRAFTLLSVMLLPHLVSLDVMHLTHADDAIVTAETVSMDDSTHLALANPQ